jgi:hypothetical protein
MLEPFPISIRMAETALSLHPINPHYFTFRGKPTVLVTSGEHYASVLNLEFDYRRYLDTLHTEGLNHTRLFVGVYRERVDEHWPRNPLGPEPKRYVCPFGRSDVPGAYDGGNKFDLNTWDEVFFSRLREFCQRANDYGIVVEVNLFCPYYLGDRNEQERWILSPWHADNNVNDLGPIPPTEIFSLKHPKLLKIQEAMVRRIVRDLNHHDNLYYEVCNEPYFDGVTLEWQYHIAELIVEEERRLPVRHLISHNVANVWAEIRRPHPAFSIFNFHYPRPEPKCVTTNYHLNKVIGCNETGFDGPLDETYRIQGWQFMLAGGGLFNHLDAAFVAGDETGSKLPGGTDKFGGGPSLRRQLRILKDFVESFDFVRMEPGNSAIEDSGDAAAVYVLAEQGKQYGVYVLRQAGKTCRSVALRVPDGQYMVQFVDVREGVTRKPEAVLVLNGRLTLELPEFRRDIAIRVLRDLGEQGAERDG